MNNQLTITLKAARVNIGLTQNEAAKKLGVSKAALSKWENGKSMPNSKYILRIESVYGIKYDNLFFKSA